MTERAIYGASIHAVEMASAKARDQIKHRDELIAELVRFKKASLREIGAAAGLSAAGVAKIAARLDGK